MIVKSSLKNAIRISQGLTIVPGINAVKDEDGASLERDLAFYIDKGLIEISDGPKSEKRKVHGTISEPVDEPIEESEKHTVVEKKSKPKARKKSKKG